MCPLAPRWQRCWLPAPCGCRSSPAKQRRARPAGTCGLSRPRVALAGVALALVAIWMVDERGRAVMAAPHWEAHMRLARNQRKLALPPDESDVAELEQILSWTPNESRAHLRLAAARLAQCDWLPPESRSVLGLSRADVGELTTDSRTSEDFIARLEQAAAAPR